MSDAREGVSRSGVWRPKSRARVAPRASGLEGPGRGGPGLLDAELGIGADPRQPEGGLRSPRLDAGAAALPREDARREDGRRRLHLPPGAELLVKAHITESAEERGWTDLASTTHVGRNYPHSGTTE